MTDWENRYRTGDMPWEKGMAAPPLMELLERHGSEIWGGGPILVPGCGLGHDVRALAATGLSVLGLDLAQTAVNEAGKFPAAGNESYETGDFLDPGWRRGRRFSAIWEHTCFCAIDPSRRSDYAAAAAECLGTGGLLAGVFFLNPNDPGDESEGPPFGTSIGEIERCFGEAFTLTEGWVPQAAYPGREGREWIGLFRRHRCRELRLRDVAPTFRRFQPMKFILLALYLVSRAAIAGDARLYVNDKPVPDSRKDLEAIQKALGDALPKARAATVCIELKDGSGSGVIVSADGVILTAAHVAMGVKKKVTVILEDGTRLKAETLGLVADKDAAMIRITEKGSYPFVEMDKAASTKLGDWVFSLGHSGGFDKARGSVVRLGRLVRIAGSSFQSDCMLIGGDSGGPLFDLTGKLIGIHSRVGAQLQVNMHVPMADYQENWDGLTRGDFIGEGPYAERPVKGSGLLGVATETRPEGGLRVTKVGNKTPAEEAGIKEGDVLLKLNDTVLTDRGQMQSMLKELAAGDEVILEAERAGKPKTFTIELGER